MITQSIFIIINVKCTASALSLCIKIFSQRMQNGSALCYNMTRSKSGSVGGCLIKLSFREWKRKCGKHCMVLLNILIIIIIIIIHKDDGYFLRNILAIPLYHPSRENENANNFYDFFFPST